jgi:hypothetical protein
MGYGASESCCKYVRTAETRRLDPVQWAPKKSCEDKAQGKAWRQPFYLALSGSLAVDLHAFALRCGRMHPPQSSEQCV